MSDQERRVIASRKQGDKLFTGKESFPSVLFSMLDELADQGHSDIVSWQPHGRCFLVHKRKDFITDVLPAFFRMSKFTSFQRQLNLYGFQRVASGKDKGGYFHELFLRGRKDLCETIPRQQVKGVGKRLPVNPASQPDFYLMEFLPSQNNAVPNNNSKVSALEMTTMPATENSQSIIESSLLASMYPSMLMPALSRAEARAIPQASHAMPAACSDTVGHANFGSFVSVMSHGVAPSSGHLAPAVGTFGIASAPSHESMLQNAMLLPVPPGAVAAALPRGPCLSTNCSSLRTFTTVNTNPMSPAADTQEPPPYSLAAVPASFALVPAPSSADESRTNMLQRASSLAAMPIINSPERRREQVGNPSMDAYAAALRATYVEALHSAYIDALHGGAAEISTRETTSDVRRSSASDESLRDWMSQNLSCDDQNIDN